MTHSVAIITARGGSTLYELCAVGTPSISYSIADNQLRNVKQFDEDGIIEYAGEVRTDAVASNVRNRIGEYRENQRLRRERSKKMQTLVDGKDAQRIADILFYREKDGILAKPKGKEQE